MGQKSGFFTSENGDRKYNADWLAQYIAGIVSNGVYTTELTATGGNGDMSVTVSAGRAWINGYMYSNNAALKLPLSTADGALGRTDLVVLRLDMSNRQIALTTVQGAFGGGVPAITRTADIYELELAQVAIAAGTTAITQAMITDKRADETVCGIVAGAVTQLSTGELLEQLKVGFDTWFANVKGQLSTDAAGNLQNEIDQLNTALASSKLKLLASYTTAGSYTFAVPAGITQLQVFIIGGGGSGAARIGYYASNPGVVYAPYATGGGSGHTARAFIAGAVAGHTYAVVVGAGGASATYGTSSSSNAQSGGSSSFNGVTANGGSGGIQKVSPDSNIVLHGADGGQGSSSDATFSSCTPAFGEIRIICDSNLQGNTISTECVNPFDNHRLLIAGGYAQGSENAQNCHYETAATDDYGHSGSSGIAVASGNATATKGTSYGCGGGAATTFSSTGLATSAAGADGAVLIYGM